MAAGDIAQACSQLRPLARAETSLEVQWGKQPRPKKQPVVVDLLACPLRLTYWSNVRRPGGKGKLVTKACLGWEEVQVLDLRGIRTLVAMAWVAAGFAYE